LFPALQDAADALAMADYMLAHIEVNPRILDDVRYDYLFSVESVNAFVLKGVPFRDAYRTVGAEIESGTFRPERQVRHTHLGSIGDLATEQISALMSDVLAQFDFAKVTHAEAQLCE
jgi:argininosuccinate lyase